MMKLLVISICRNEEETIAKVIAGVPRKITGIKSIEKIVLDDGSNDGTVRAAKAAGAEVISDGTQKGLAFRFREAIDAALSKKADVLVNIDGDMQFDPKDIPRLLKPITEGRADFVAADRFSTSSGKSRRPSGMPLGKFLGNLAGAKVVSKLSKHEFRDVTCGFRAYNRKALFALNTDGVHTYTQESFQVLAAKKLRIEQVPVSVRYYEGRKSRVVKSIFHYVAVSAVSILRSYRDLTPLRFFGWLGFIPFLVGSGFLGFFLIHWVAAGSFSPYKFTGFVGIYLVTLAIIFWALGLVADMLSRMLNNQEKILERVKRLEAKSNLYASSENSLEE